MDVTLFGAEMGNVFAEGQDTYLKNNLNASRPSEHPQVRGQNVKTFSWDHRLFKESDLLLF